MARRGFPAIPVLAGVALASPALWVGLQADDLHIRAIVLGEYPLTEALHNSFAVYTFLDGDPAHTQQVIEHGLLPWWSDPWCRVALMRPLSAMTFMLDYRLWPESPVLMHAHSLLWFAAMLAAAAVLYRRWLASEGPPWVPGLAALLFAVDDAHALPAGWLANRNAVIAVTFGCLAMIFHDRWRRDRWRVGALAAPLSLVLALLGKEEAVSTGAYLLGYALFVERGTLRRRLSSLLPCVLAGTLWFVWYKANGYGVSGSGVYVDPANDPAGFLGRVLRNGPILLLAQWATPPADLSLMWSPGAFRVHWGAAVCFLLVLGCLFRSLLARDRTARFFAFGMVLSVIPPCAIFPGDRLLGFAGLGAMGLLARWLAARHDLEQAAARPRSYARLSRAFLPALVVVHLVLAPLALPLSVVSMRVVGGVMESYYGTMPNDPALRQQTVVFVNSMVGLVDLFMARARSFHGDPNPRRSINLNAACSSADLTRVDERTLSVRPEGGFLPPREWWPKSAEPPPWMSPAYHLQDLDWLVRSPSRPMHVGDRVMLPDVTIEVLSLTDDGRPAVAIFLFQKPLDDPSYRWLEMTPAGYVAFEPPAVGETVRVHAPMPPSRRSPPRPKR